MKQTTYRSIMLVTASMLASLTAQAFTLEIPRQISRAVNDRLEINFRDAQQNTVSDQASFWDAFSYTSIVHDKTDSDRDLYQASLGVDKSWNNLTAGVAVTYARLEGSGLLDDKSNVPAITPYFDYMFNQYAHVTVLGGYIRKQGVGNRGNINSGFSDISLNMDFPYMLDEEHGIRSGFSFKPRIGYRFAHSGFGITNSDGRLTYTNTLYAEGGVEYAMQHVAVYFRSLYERVAHDTELPNPKDGEDLVFITAGVDYHVSNAATIGVAYRHQILENEFNYHQAMARMSMQF